MRYILFIGFISVKLVCAQGARDVAVPPITGHSIETHLASQETNVRRVTIYKDSNYEGESFDVSQDTPKLPKLNREASSLVVENSPSKWTILWESKNFNGGDDQLWIQGSRSIRNLGDLARPHGNNEWNDRISAISFSDTPPDTNDENRTVCLSGGGCFQQPNFSGHTVGSNLGSSAAHLRGGWFVRVCPHYMTSQAIVFEAGAAHDDSTHRPWFTWNSNSNDPVEFDLPIDLLYARDVWIKGTSVPWGAESRFCVGYANHFSWQYSFGHDEDHQPDQDDHNACQC